MSHARWRTSARSASIPALEPRRPVLPTLILSLLMAAAAVPAAAAGKGLRVYGEDGGAEQGCRALPWAEVVQDGHLEDLPPAAAEALSGAQRIGHVVVVRNQVFNLEDPKENNVLYRLADRLHILSREQAVLELLPFHEGDAYVPEQLHEAERILRDTRALYDARVVPVRQCGTSVDVAVVTRDVWSIVPTGDVNRSGGENSFALGLKDVNLLGRGETFGAYYENGVDRDGVSAFYNDPSLNGTPWTLGVFGSDNSDGGRLALDVRKPFRSLDDLQTKGFTVVADKRVEPLYARSRRFAEFQHQELSGELFLGTSTGRIDGNVRRWSVGVGWFDHQFDREPGPLQPVRLPDDRRAVYPFVSLELIEDQWGSGINLDAIQRTEDIYLGRRIFAKVGYSPKAFGADQGRLLVDASWENAAQPTPDWLLSWSAKVDGAITSSDHSAENLISTVGMRVHYRQTDSFGAFASLDGTWAKGLTRDRQLLLGGDNGLRGYPQRYQDGDRQVRARLEERWFSGSHPFQLFRFGLAAFVDGGRSWFSSDRNDEETGWLADVGVGLRLSSTRVPSRSIVHIDVAAPLRTGGRKVKSVEVSLTLRETF